MKTLLIASLAISTTAFVILKTYFHQVDDKSASVKAPTNVEFIKAPEQKDQKSKAELSASKNKQESNKEQPQKVEKKRVEQKAANDNRHSNPKKKDKRDGHDFKELLEDDIEFIEMT